MNIISNSRLWRWLKRNEKFYNRYSKTLGAVIKKYRLRSRIEAVQQEGISRILELEKVLENVKVRFFVDNGTLLGLIRDKKILSWDYDIDFGIYIDDEFTWEDLENTLNAIGYVKHHQFVYNGVVTEQTYEKENIFVDFFNHFNRDSSSEFYVFFKENDYDYEKQEQFHTGVFTTVKLSGTRLWDIGDGKTFHVPIEYEEYLCGLYGKTWMIPDPNWVERTGPAYRFLDGEIAYYEGAKVQ